MTLIGYRSSLKMQTFELLDRFELLYQTICNREFIVEAFTSLSDFCAYFLSLIPATGRKETINEVKTSDMPSFSLQAMNDSIKKFYVIAQIFLREDEHRNAILAIPDDVVPFFNEFLKEHQPRLESALNVIKKQLQ